MENKFLDRVSNLIQNKTARESITAELESHILDKADYYEEIGYSKEIAMQKATEEMGNPDDTAVPLNALHKKSAVKGIWSIITAVFVVAFSLLCFNVIPIEHRFYYADNNYTIYHTVTADFISMLVLFLFVFLLYKAYRHKNLTSVIMLILSLIVMLTANLTNEVNDGIQFAIFQPLFYPVITFIKCGISGYADSIFGYSYIVDSDKIIYRIGAFAVFVVLLLLALIIVIAVFRQRRLKSARILLRISKTSCSAMCIILCVITVAMSISAAFAVINIEEKRREMKEARKNAIDFVIKADISGGLDKLNEQLLEEGYEYCYCEYEEPLGKFDETNMQSVNNYRVFSAIESQCALWQKGFCNTAIMTYGDSLHCVSTTFENTVTFPEEDFYLTYAEWLQFDYVEEDGFTRRPTIEEFFNCGFYTKAIAVGRGEKTISFTFANIENHQHLTSYSFQWSDAENTYILMSRDRTDESVLY
ncbi:permease prefix domain 1-containing protein [uncultured Ruminococcus sp.]|uniref:permease prefix domain 1-containing protein n=1 Tax=uncultured Ruminococcus sp. TaxID=165186 RepID=UPI0025E39632|nr:permease prefix domain 1-containing protein [uncultured Ruminococcus sp.]